MLKSDWIKNILKKTEERQYFLKNFLDERVALTNSNKELLERKLTKTGLDTLCQTRRELNELQTEFNNLQENQESYIQTPPK